MRLDAGTLLVSSGVITEPQLKQALGARVNRGGTLVENLVWLGHANDIEVAHTLTIQLGLPRADASQLQNLPTFVTRLLPLEIIRNHHLVPIMLDQGVLHVAMSDPTERAALEEVAFATGYIAAPVITPVNVLRAAMARYYSFDPMESASVPSANGTPPTPPATVAPAASLPVFEHGAESAGEGSVEPAAGELEELFRSGREDSVVQLTQLKIPDPLRSAGDIAEAVLLNMVDEKGHPAPVADTQKDSSSEEPVVAESIPDLPGVPGRLVAASGTFPPAEVLATPQTAPSSEPMVEPLFDGEAARMIVRDAVVRDEVAKALLRYSVTFLNRVVLFAVKNDILVGWMGSGQGVSDRQVKGIIIPLSSPSIFKTVKDTGTDYFGSIPRTTVNDIFLSALGSAKPSQALLVPISVRHKLISILYGDCGSDSGFQKDLSPLHLFVIDVATAFERIILQKKIGRSVIR